VILGAVVFDNAAAETPNCRRDDGRRAERSLLMEKAMNRGIGLCQRVEIHRRKPNMNYGRQLPQRSQFLCVENEDGVLDANDASLARLNLLVLVKTVWVIGFSGITALAQVLLRVSDNTSSFGAS